LRYVTIPILLPGIIGVAMGAFTLSYDEYARTTLVIGAILSAELYFGLPNLFDFGLYVGTIATAAARLSATQQQVRANAELTRPTRQG